MTFVQIYAILALLTAFGVPQPTVDTVQSILFAAQAPQAVQLGVGGPVESVQPAPKSTSPSVGLQVNGQTGTVDILKSSCIQQGIKTCGQAEISWNSVGTIPPGCGILGTTDWSGNQGTNGSQIATIHQDTTIFIQCQTDTGIISSSVEVHLK